MLFSNRGEGTNSIAFTPPSRQPGLRCTRPTHFTSQYLMLRVGFEHSPTVIGSHSTTFMRPSQLCSRRKVPGWCTTKRPSASSSMLGGWLGVVSQIFLCYNLHTRPGDVINPGPRGNQAWIDTGNAQRRSKLTSRLLYAGIKLAGDTLRAVRSCVAAAPGVIQWKRHSPTSSKPSVPI